MDEINTEALRHKVKGKSCLKKLVPNGFDRAVKSTIEDVLERLKFVLDQKDYLGLREGVQSRQIQRFPAPLIGDPSDVCGRNDDKEAIVSVLLSENNAGDDKIPAIPIVGMGGIGKTTLARFIYNDDRVKNHFNLRAWVTVSDDFNVLRITKQAVKELTSEECNADELGQLQVKLEDTLRGKKFILILDDVWCEDYIHCDALKSCFQFGASESKIIVTTRSEDVASAMGGIPYSLQKLSEGDCWQLFRKHAFHNVEPAVCQDLEDVGRKLVAQCKGLPLAVKSLGGLLRSVSNGKEWEEILKSEVWK